MTRDCVTEQNRRRAYAKTTGIIQAPYQREYTNSVSGDDGKCSLLHSNVCDRCANLLIDGSKWHAGRKQTLCFECHKEITNDSTKGGMEE